MSEFGGAWTVKKLECVSRYLVAYQIALKKWDFDLVYIDAFCGDGAQKLKVDDGALLQEARGFTRGSAQRAIELDLPFSQYHFVDKSKTSLDRLRTTLVALKPALEDRMQWRAGDVNVVLPQIVRGLNPKRSRAVMFADPFGMQLDWETIKVIAACPIIDFWYLVPTGLAINRLVTRDGKMPKAWADRLDRFLGEKEWRTRWYQKTGQGDLFGGADEVAKSVDLEQIEVDFQKRLGEAFALVAPKRLQLKDKGRVLFTLMFACSNPSPKAHGLAIKIANHLLKS